VNNTDIKQFTEKKSQTQYQL